MAVFGSLFHIVHPLPVFPFPVLEQEQNGNSARPILGKGARDEGQQQAMLTLPCMWYLPSLSWEVKCLGKDQFGHLEESSRAVIFNWCGTSIFKTCHTCLFSQGH